MPQLSQRTRRLIEKGNESPLGAALFKTFANQYDAEKNPRGVVNAGLAENVSVCALAGSIRSGTAARRAR